MKESERISMAQKEHFDIEKEENISRSSRPKKLQEQYGTKIRQQKSLLAFRLEKIEALLARDFEEATITLHQYQQVLEQVKAVFAKNLAFLQEQLKIQIHMAKTEGTVMLYLLDQKLEENEKILQKLAILCDKLALIELEESQMDVAQELDALIEQTRLYKEQDANEELDF